MLLQFCHLPCELRYGDRPPPVVYGSDTMKHQDVPAGLQPTTDIFRPIPTYRMRNTINHDKCRVVYSDEAAIYFVEVCRALLGTVTPSRSPSRLLIPRTDYGVLDGISDVTKRITVRRNFFYLQSILNPFF